MPQPKKGQQETPDTPTEAQVTEAIEGAEKGAESNGSASYVAGEIERGVLIAEQIERLHEARQANRELLRNAVLSGTATPEEAELIETLHPTRAKLTAEERAEKEAQEALAAAERAEKRAAELKAKADAARAKIAASKA